MSSRCRGGRFPPVLWGDIHISGVVKGRLCGESIFVGLEQIKFEFRPKVTGNIHLFSPCNGLFQKEPAVPLEGGAIGILNLTKHPHNPALRGAPRQYRKRRRVGEKE